MFLTAEIREPPWYIFFGFFFQTLGLGIFLMLQVLPRYTNTVPVLELAKLMRPKASEIILVIATQVAITVATFLWFERMVMFLIDMAIWTAIYPQLRPTLVEKKPLTKLFRLYYIPLLIVGMAELLIFIPGLAFIPIPGLIIGLVVWGILIHGKYVYHYGDCLAALWLGTPQFNWYTETDLWAYNKST